MSVIEEDRELALFLAESYDMSPEYHRIDKEFIKANAPAIRSMSDALLDAEGVSEFRNVLARLNKFTRHYDSHVSKTTANE